MSTEHRWSKFWWQDWQRDSALRMCSMAARGFWMELLCIAHEGEPYGHVVVNGRAPTPRQLGMIVGSSEKETTSWISELEQAGVFSRTADGVIFCRRMVRDKTASDIGREHGKKGGNPSLNGKSPHGAPPTGGVNPPPKPHTKPGPLRGADNRGPNLQEAEAESEDRKGRKGRARARARPPTLRPEDWSPGEADVAFGVKLGLSEAVISAAAERMRDWVLTSGKLPNDWAAMFRNWLRDDQKRDATRRGPRLSNWEQIHRDLGTQSLLLGPWDDDIAPDSGLGMLQ